MRLNFRDFFTYAIKSYQLDPIESNLCSLSCYDEKNCCANIIATDIKTNEIAKDNFCMLKTVVNSWNNFTLNAVYY